MDERDEPPPAGWADVPIAIERLVVQLGNGTEWPVVFDRALGVEMGGERGYIVGNAHTHRGRFDVCFPDRGYVTTVSVYELTAISAEARYWLVGFLTGYE